MSDAKPASRRRHDTELKRQVIAACTAPGASVAQVAMSYGLNANLVHKWRRLAGHDGEPAGSPAFVPVSVVTKAPQCEPPQSIELELQRGPVHVRVRWPMAGAASCAKLNRLAPYAYLRDVLERLPAHPASRIDELLPHRWTVPTISSAPCGTGSK